MLQVAMVKLLQKFSIGMAEETRRETIKGDMFLNTYKNMFIHVKEK